jgi:hypothetical protein
MLILQCQGATEVAAWQSTLPDMFDTVGIWHRHRLTRRDTTQYSHELVARQERKCGSAELHDTETTSWTVTMGISHLCATAAAYVRAVLLVVV